jgi:hypothetical protein
LASHLRRRFSLRNIEQAIKQIKVILFDVALLILFVVALVRLVRGELGW